MTIEEIGCGSSYGNCSTLQWVYTSKIVLKKIIIKKIKLREVNQKLFQFTVNALGRIINSKCTKDTPQSLIGLRGNNLLLSYHSSFWVERSSSNRDHLQAL